MKRACLVALVAVAGCGGGDDAKEETSPAKPKPGQEPLSAAARRLQRVLPTRDCKQLAKLMLHSVRRGRDVPPSKPPTPAECRFIATEITRELPGFKVRTVRQFVPTGFVEGTGSKLPQGFVVGTLWIRDTDGAWKMIYSAFTREQIGFPPRVNKPVAAGFVRAIRSRNCRRIWRYLNVGSRFVRGANGKEAAFCKVFLPAFKDKGNGIADLAAHPAKPRELGAVRDFAFYELDLSSGRGMVFLLSGRIKAGADKEQAQHYDPSVLEFLTVRRPSP